jgi:hypothetical protein
MVSVASQSPSPMVRSEEDLGPPWLRPLLGTSFFVPCRMHPELSKNECNLFCLGCTGDALCAYCLPAHRDHHVVQVSQPLVSSSSINQPRQSIRSPLLLLHFRPPAGRR